MSVGDVVSIISAVIAMVSCIAVIVSNIITKQVIRDSKKPKIDLLFSPLGGYIADIYIRNVSSNTARDVTFEVSCSKKNSELFSSLKDSLSTLKISQMVGDEKYLFLCHYESDDIGNGKPVEVTISFCDEDNNYYSCKQTVDLRTTGGRIIADQSPLTTGLQKITKELSAIKEAIKISSKTK